MSKRRRKSVYIQPPHEVNSKRERTTTTRTTRSKAGPRTRALQEIPPPSLKRTAKMLPIYFVVMFGLQYLLPSNGNLEGQAKLVSALLMSSMICVVFFPLLHMMEKSRFKRMTKLRDKAQGKASDLPVKNGRAVKG